MSNPAIIYLDTESTPETSKKKRQRRTSHDSPSFLSSPIKKRLSNRILNHNEKLTAVNLYKYVYKSMTTYPYKQEIYKTVAEIMGTSVKTVQRVISEYKNTGELSSPKKRVRTTLMQKLDNFTLTAIKRKVQQFHLNNEVPTVDKVLTAINEDEDMPSFSRSTLYQIMKKLNLKRDRLSRKNTLLNKPGPVASPKLKTSEEHFIIVVQ